MFVSAGSVILEAPVLPVTEGNDVTLTCRQRSSTSSSNFTACFYKDGIPVVVSSTGNMSLSSVSTPDEGSYRCKMLEGGESPSTWLTVAGEEAQWYVSLRQQISSSLLYQRLFQRRLLMARILQLLCCLFPCCCASWWEEVLTCCLPSCWRSYTEREQEVRRTHIVKFRLKNLQLLL